VRLFVIFCAIVLGATVLAPLGLSAHSHVCCTVGDEHMFRGKDIDVNLDHGSIIFKHGDDDGTVEITEGYALIVNGNELHLRQDQRMLVRDYYNSFEAVLDDAKTIGISAAKLGVKGAATAIVEACRALCGESVEADEHSCDRNTDRETARLDEEKAKIERRAERLKRKAENLEKLHVRLREHVSELDRLGWF
jgi:hypothetical protein